LGRGNLMEWAPGGNTITPCRCYTGTIQSELGWIYQMKHVLKRLSSRCTKNKKNIKINGKYWSVEKSIIFYCPIYSVDKSLVKHRFLCIIYCVTNAVAVMYSRNISMAEQRIVCFQSKTVKLCRFFLIFNNYYIYLKTYFEKNVTNDF